MNPSPRTRILRGYGPLVAFALVFLLMALFFPTVGRKVVNVNGVGAAAGPGGDEVDAGTAAGGGPAGGQAAGAGGAGSGSAAGAARGAAPPGSTSACPDRKEQVPGDTYSPPCIGFSGSNGGATSRGVNNGSIVVGYPCRATWRYQNESQRSHQSCAWTGGAMPSAMTTASATSSRLARYINRA